MHCSVSLPPEQEKLLSHVFLALTGSRDAAVVNVTIIMHPAVPFLWCNRVGGKTLNRTTVAGGQLSSRMFGKDPFAVYTSLPTVQKAINTRPGPSSFIFDTCINSKKDPTSSRRNSAWSLWWEWSTQSWCTRTSNVLYLSHTDLHSNQASAGTAKNIDLFVIMIITML